MWVSLEISLDEPLQALFNKITLLYTVEAMSVGYKELLKLKMNIGMEEFCEEALRSSPYSEKIKNDLVSTFIQLQWQASHEQAEDI